MTVKIVTDSSADLTDKIVQELGVTVVPLYVRFGEEVYRDRVDISENEFYQRLQHDPIHPSTTQPSPQDFVDVYQKLSQEADGIVSIHISSVLSGTCNSALQGRELAGVACPIEVIDSRTLTMALGMMVIATAKLANMGKGLDEVVAEAKRAIATTHLLGLFDTLEYVRKGGRIGRAKALLGSILNVKPLLTLQDGDTAPASQARTRSKGIDRLFDFVKSTTNIEELAVVYNTNPEEAQALVERIGSIFDKKRIYLATVGPMLGVHMGPGALIVAKRGN
ncbi:DegV family protein [Chloroflexota bacterium]